MSDIILLISEAKQISEGDRGQILLQKKKPSKELPVKGDNKGQKMGEDPDPSKVISSGKSKGKKVIKGSVPVKESRTEKAKGSKSGRESIHTYDDKPHTNPKKARVRVYSSITDALRRGYIGQIFSTKGADRLYVITRQKWGKDKEQMVAGRTAKGFTPGSIPAKFADVKKYAVRTMVRHAGASKRGKSKYLPQSGKIKGEK